VANGGHFNVANGFVSEYIKISKFLQKKKLSHNQSFYLISHFLAQNNQTVFINVAQDISFP
jgi:hypothetical protein